MATKRKVKGKAKTKRKKKPVSKGAGKKTVKKAKTVRKKITKKAPLRPVSRKKASAAKPAGKPRSIDRQARQAVKAPPSRPAKSASSEQRIGVVTHYYSHLSVVVMQLEPGATLRVGEIIHVWGHTTDFTQKVESLEVDHSPVAEVGAKDDFGLKVIEHAREHDVVFKVQS